MFNTTTLYDPPSNQKGKMKTGKTRSKASTATSETKIAVAIGERFYYQHHHQYSSYYYYYPLVGSGFVWYEKFKL